MPPKNVVILGNQITGRNGIVPVIGQFGWITEVAADMGDLVKLGARHNAVVVLIHAAEVNLPWKQTLAAVRRAAPEAAIILCHRFSEAIDGAEASAEGVFSLLHLPLDLGELRQSLGFVWAAGKKRPHVIRTGAASVRASRRVA